MKFRLVDKIISLDPGKKIHCQYTWPEDLEIFQDHFPGYPVVPGVLLIEMMAQTAGIPLECGLKEPIVPILIQIKDAKFHDRVRPGICLDIYAEVVSVQKMFSRTKARIEINGKIVATTELLNSFESSSTLGLPIVSPELEQFLNQSND